MKEKLNKKKIDGKYFFAVVLAGIAIKILVSLVSYMDLAAYNLLIIFMSWIGAFWIGNLIVIRLKGGGNKDGIKGKSA